MKKISLSIWAILFFVFTLFGCDGGGSSDSPSSKDRVYPLTNYKPNEPENLRITGSDTSGAKISGTSQSEYLGDTFLNDIKVSEVRTIGNLVMSKNGDQIALNTTIYSYYKKPGILYKKIDQDGNTDVALSFEEMPDEVRIGDFGTCQTIKRSSGRIETETWSALDGGSGNLKIEFVTADKSSGVAISKNSVYIAPDGKTIKRILVVYATQEYPYTITLEKKPM